MDAAGVATCCGCTDAVLLLAAGTKTCKRHGRDTAEFQQPLIRCCHSLAYNAAYLRRGCISQRGASSRWYFAVATAAAATCCYLLLLPALYPSDPAHVPSNLPQKQLHIAVHTLVPAGRMVSRRQAVSAVPGVVAVVAPKFAPAAPNQPQQPPKAFHTFMCRVIEYGQMFEAVQR